MKIKANNIFSFQKENRRAIKSFINLQPFFRVGSNFALYSKAKRNVHCQCSSAG
jgi:hypothetical protein